MKPVFRKIFGAAAFSSAMFVFQACYGVPQDGHMDVCISGTVFSDTASTPVKGIKVTTDNNLTAITDDSGHFAIYTSPMDSVTLTFSDIDSTQNSEYITFDTILKHVKNNADLEIRLSKKQ